MTDLRERIADTLEARIAVYLSSHPQNVRGAAERAADAVMVEVQRDLDALQGKVSYLRAHRDELVAVAASNKRAADAAEAQVARLDRMLVQGRESRDQIGDRYLEAVEALKAAEADAARLAEAGEALAQALSPGYDSRYGSKGRKLIGREICEWESALAAHRERENQTNDGGTYV